MRNKLLYLLPLLLLCNSVEAKQHIPDISNTRSVKGTFVFKDDSASIAQHYQSPTWFRNAKFGIFIHWGVYSVPAYGNEWYPRNMYDSNSDVHRHHVETYGPVDQFGYKDFIPMFKAERFNPEQWAKLFKEAGARYVVPVAEHHDGFAMYQSTFNHWNAAEMGPKRDILGELKAAILHEGMHFGLSSHRAENAWFYNMGMKIPSDVRDTTITLYGERIGRPGKDGEMNPDPGQYPGSNERSKREWLMHTYELIDNYQPELIWFDWTVGMYPFRKTFYKFLAHYYNSALDWKKQVVVNTKFGYGDNIQVTDIERGKSDKIRKYPWQTDTSVGKHAWCYVNGEENKSPDQIIDDLIDIVSKNGNMLLNIGPKSDGTISDEQQRVLREIGKWLKANGDCIYGTRPWKVYGEGANKGTAGYMTDNKATNYEASDIRYTVKGNSLYAISLAWTDGNVTMRSLKGMRVKGVSLLGSGEHIIWKNTANGLLVKFPHQKPNEYAYAFKIKL